ncbi:MFS transporter [Tumebacillus sp. ITR2]|uniref:MFS transporter n=1 Tax=Tumebacillus amylolyticus TaxID=2801339 RepID=A0ABS1JD91_9BACL|nr:MFS transporter [Tumebacillus amylolyticus]
MWTAISNRSFRALWLSQLMSKGGDQLRSWSIVYWIFTTSGQSPWMQAMLLLADFGPAALLGPFAGVFVDRWSHLRVMRYAHLIRAVFSFALIPAFASGSIGWVLLCVTLSSVVAQFFEPASNALVPALIEKDQLMAANSVTRASNTLWLLLGPVLATTLYHTYGPTTTFALDGISFVLAFGALLFIKGPQAKQVQEEGSRDQEVEAKRERGGFWKELGDGLRFSFSNGTVRAILLLLVMLSFGIGVINLLGLFLVKQVLGLPDLYVAWASTSQGVGMLLTATLLGLISKRIRSHRTMTVVSVVILGIGVVLFACSQNEFQLICSRFLIGGGVTAMNVAITTLFMREVPEHLMGRVGSVVETAPTYAMLLSMLLGSTLAAWFSIRGLFMGVGGLFLLTALVAMRELGVGLFGKRRKQEEGKKNLAS